MKYAQLVIKWGYYTWKKLASMNDTVPEKPLYNPIQKQVEVNPIDCKQ